MPIAFRKDATTRICLKADEDRPEEERVYFLCRFITYEQRLQIYEKLKLANDKATSNADTGKLINEALAIGIIGPVAGTKTPDGRDVPATIDGIRMVLSPNEIWDLAYEYPRAVGLSEVDLKKSASPTQSSTAGSAKAAE